MIFFFFWARKNTEQNGMNEMNPNMAAVDDDNHVDGDDDGNDDSSNIQR